MSEQQQEKAESKAVYGRLFLGLAAAKLDAKEKGFRRGCAGAGDVQCPVCETGRIYYRVAAINGHMHARCNTEGCVRWME